ncbi:conserved hypothetical protein [Vibrio crassostreae]|uniref:hypothetical protein n=1 Tax=Vibrio crassostreae TaxID=246167 RepID=UPI000F45F0AA|nr:hypothetical protein [Vibrio crassostreae]NOH73559.1 hypothetical protein [Vibrio crassostreae]ROR19896.1 hypothetical protein EDB36_1011054 [Vibrio crassostreae]CAK2361370.1 conserved hypothetical protein [Vibrio crassostreae]CAK2375554.1 conserved hypothetical protein [Vibrio crassostreae]CAK2525531.1 conserved hypothetical protein [Vibrio crassostreae]
MALLILFLLVLLWGFLGWLNDDVILFGLVVPILVLVASILYGSYTWLKIGSWGSFDVLTVFCTIKKECFGVYSFSSYVGFAKLNNWYLSTNVAWTATLVPMFGNMFCTLVLDNIEPLKRLKKYLFTCNSPTENH